jgi:hypothetical protein
VFEAAGRFPPRHGQPRVARIHGITAAFPRPTAGPLWHDPALQWPPGREVAGMPPLEPIWVAFVTVMLTGCRCWPCGRFVADAGAAETGSPGRVLADAADQLTESWT